jgi:hypothetical protein
MTDCSLIRKLRSFFVQNAWLTLLSFPAAVVFSAAVLSAQTAPAPAANAGSTSSDQPITYSHKLHAGELQMQCTYCHSGARRSAVAGVPAVNVCTGCHRWVKNKTAEMKKIDEYAQQKRPIVWKRLNEMAEHVYFSHKRHVLGGLECGTCHGPVETMEQAPRIERLTMGWCVECHEQRRAPLECSTCHN